MAKEKWAESKTIQFVNEYINQECLWNSKYEGYNNKTDRDAAYLEIARKMDLGPNFGIPEVKNKIKNLRNTYTQKIQKIKDLKKQGQVHVPSLAWFNLMDSVLKNGEKKRTRGDTDTDEIDEKPKIKIRKSMPAPPTISHPSPPSTVKIKKIKIKRDTSLPVKLNHSPVEEITHRQVSFTPAKSIVKSEEYNEFDAFGRMISLSLKNMSMERAIHTQQFIHTYLNKQRLLEIRSEVTPKRRAPQIAQVEEEEEIEYESSDDNTETDPFFKMEITG